MLDAHGSLHMIVEALTQPVFSSEMVTLSRLVYKCRNQLRHWKGFSRLKQVFVGFCVKMLKLNLDIIICDYHICLMAICQVNWF